MRPSKIRQKLRAGGVVRIANVGHYLPYFPHLAAHVGFDGVWVDAEHRAWDPREIGAMIAQHHLADIDCVWRTPTIEKSGIARLLEDGASAIMIPHVNTPERAALLAEAAKFPPLGDRGLDGAAHDAGYWVGKSPDYVQLANEETLLILQIETPVAVSNIDAIISTPGVDLIFVGPGDLSLRLGCRATVSDPVLRKAVETVAAACERAGKPWGIPAGTEEEIRAVVDMGCRFVAHGGEFWAIHDRLRESQETLDKALG